MANEYIQLKDGENNAYPYAAPAFGTTGITNNTLKIGDSDNSWNVLINNQKSLAELPYYVAQGQNLEEGSMPEGWKKIASIDTHGRSLSILLSHNNTYYGSSSQSFSAIIDFVYRKASIYILNSIVNTKSITNYLIIDKLAVFPIYDETDPDDGFKYDIYVHFLHSAAYRNRPRIIIQPFKNNEGTITTYDFTEITLTLQQEGQFLDVVPLNDKTGKIQTWNPSFSPVSTTIDTNITKLYKLLRPDGIQEIFGVLCASASSSGSFGDMTVYKCTYNMNFNPSFVDTPVITTGIQTGTGLNGVFTGSMSFNNSKLEYIEFCRPYSTTPPASVKAAACIHIIGRWF